MKLTTKKRNNLSDKSFALPGRRYPIPDEAHGRDALARVSANGTPTEQDMVRKEVARRFPGVKVSKKK